MAKKTKAPEAAVDKKKKTVTIIGTGLNKHLKKDEQFEVAPKLAKVLIEKKSAVLKEGEILN